MDTDEHGLTPPLFRRTTSAKRFAPYMVEMVIIHDPKLPIRHYVHVYLNGGTYIIELHKNNPPTSTSSLGIYGQHWIITKARENEAVTECVVTTPGGWITRYILLTQMARKLQNDIAVYEAQQQKVPKPATQVLNSNQHFISQVLLRRFSTDGRIQKYTLKYGIWSRSAPRSVFSNYGYNQLLAFGEFNNELDERLKALEDTLPDTLAALDDAAKAKETVLDPEIYTGISHLVCCSRPAWTLFCDFGRFRSAS